MTESFLTKVLLFWSFDIFTCYFLLKFNFVTVLLVKVLDKHTNFKSVLKNIQNDSIIYNISLEPIEK